MIARKIDGRRAAEVELSRLKKRISRLKTKPRLATIMVGRRFDSALYIRLKTKAAQRVGMKTNLYHLPVGTSQKTLGALIQKLNVQKSISGILLQLPLPAKLDAQKAINAIDPKKDVDGFHPSQSKVKSPTLAAILALVRIGKPKHHGVAVILGRQSILAKQLSRQLQRLGYSVTIMASGWARKTRHADLIVTMLGRGQKLMGGDVKRGTVIVDVGIRSENGKTVGDVDASAWKVAKAISPVPGGVGPLTVAYVLKNCIDLHQRL